MAILIRRLFNYEVVCTDVETTNELRRRFQREEIPFYLCDLSKTVLPFPDDCFDVVLFCDALFLIPQDPRKVLKEFNRILKSRGLLILDVPNFLSLYNRIRTLLGKEKTNWCSPYPHYREYTAEELRNLLAQTNFFVKKINLCNTFTPEDISSLSRPMKLLIFHISEALTRFTPSLRDTVIAIGEKKDESEDKELAPS